MIPFPLATLFISALELSGRQRLLLMWPLCLAVAVVYKTTRCTSVREVPAAAAALWGTIIFGLYAVGVFLWAVFQLMT